MLAFANALLTCAQCMFSSLELIFSSQRAAQRAILPSHTSPPEILVNHVNHVNHVNYVNLAKLFEFSKN